MKYFIAFFALATMWIVPSGAQHIHDHQHNRNEIGVSVGGVYSLYFGGWGAGVHAHYYRSFGDHSRWAWGAMLEQAWVEGGHTTLGAGIKFQVTRSLGVGILPGVTFFGHGEGHSEESCDSHRPDKNRSFSMHLDVVYDLIHWDRFHLGPVVDFSMSREDIHSMIGLHGAYCF